MTRPMRTRRLPERYRDENHAALSASCEGHGGKLTITYEEAMATDEKQDWIEAMTVEIKSLEAKRTWEIIDRPENANVLPSKWVLTKKFDGSGNFLRYKARITAGGHRQKKGEDYTDVYAPVVSMPTIRLIIAWCTKHGWIMEHSDVETAYPNATLRETVYMRQPKGFSVNTHQVLILRKALYGLCQAGLEWWRLLTKVLRGHGFTQLLSDPTIFLKEDTIVAVYVDDLIICATNQTSIEAVKKYLDQHFRMKHLGQLQHILGMRIEFSGGAAYIDQTSYIQSDMEVFGMENVASTPSPMTSDTISEGGEKITKTFFDYRKAVGSLLWIARCTRPDTLHSISILSKYLEHPTLEHVRAAKRVLRYLGGTIELKLRICGKGNDIDSFTDCDYAADLKSRKSRTGASIFVYGGPIIWTSKMQPVVATSTTEAEYIAAAMEMKDALWLKAVLTELGKDPGPINLKVDNQGAIALIKTGSCNPKSRHIDVRFHFIREHIENGNCTVKFVGTLEQVSDIFTKAVSKQIIQRLRKKFITFQITTQYGGAESKNVMKMPPTTRQGGVLDIHPQHNQGQGDMEE